MQDTISDDLIVIGNICSDLKRLDMCPKCAEEGAPNAIVEVFPAYETALQGIAPGHALTIITWLHLADRNTQLVHPKGDVNTPLTGVFLTRSPDRPNPVGIHHVQVLGLDHLKITVSAIEALDGTPVIDIKRSIAT